MGIDVACALGKPITTEVVKELAAGRHAHESALTGAVGRQARCRASAFAGCPLREARSVGPIPSRVFWSCQNIPQSQFLKLLASH
jgi:hypothetical protein